jgi:hypothetical protein
MVRRFGFPTLRAAVEQVTYPGLDLKTLRWTSQASQNKLIDAVFSVLNNGASTGILFGVRPALGGGGQDVDCFPIPTAPTVYIINIVVDAASVIPAAGPPLIDPQW